MEEITSELDSELCDFLNQVEDDNQKPTEGSIYVAAHNGMSEDMKEIDALYVIENAHFERAVVIYVTWEVAHPKEPKNIEIDFEVDVNKYRKRRIEETRKFRRELACGDYCKKDMDMGLIKHRGYSELDREGGVVDVLTSTLGRHAASIIAFLQGSDTYQAVDLSYDDSWGSW